MGEAAAFALLGGAFAVIGFFAAVKALSAPKAKNVIEEHQGTWRRCAETVASSEGTMMRIVLIRERQGRETGRLLVAEILSRDPHFTSKLQEAIAEADNQQATLEYGESQ